MSKEIVVAAKSLRRARSDSFTVEKCTSDMDEPLRFT